MTRTVRILALLACFAAAVRADEPAGPSEPGPWSAIEPRTEDALAPAGAGSASSLSPTNEDRALRRGSAASRTSGATSADTGGGWLRSVGSLGAVVGVILFLAWGYKATTSGAAMRLKARRPGLIQIVSRTSLSSRQSFCLVRVGPRMVLVGVSGDALRTLDVIDDADLVCRLAGEAETVKTSPGFKAALERDLSRYESDDAPAPAAPSNTRARIAQALETLARAKR